MNKKVMYILATILIFVTIGCVTYFVRENKCKMTNEKQSKEKQIENKEYSSDKKISKDKIEKNKSDIKEAESLRLEGSKYREKLDYKNIFPDVYSSYLAGKKKGKNGEDLRKGIKKGIAFEEGRFRYAFDRGYGFTQKQGEKKIKKYIANLKKISEFKEEYGKIYKSLGTTVDELYTKDKISVLKNETIIRYEEKEIHDMKEYKKIKKKVLSDFQKTKYWETLDAAIDRAIDLLEKEPKPTVEEIEKAKLNVYKNPYKQ